jgi:hypothetical protein
MIAQFALRLLCGISLTWLMLPRSQITPGFFRIQSLLALALGALGGITLGATVFGHGETPLLAAPVLRGACFVAAGLAYVSSVLWTLGRRRGGTACLLAIAAISTGTLLAGSLSRESSSTGLSVLTTFSELATALTIGGATVGMLLGHWYLTSPTMSIAPLSTANLCFASAAGLRLVVSAAALAIGRQTLAEGNLAGTPLMWLVLRWLAGIVAPLVLALMVWRILRYRNTQAATGVLFVGVIVTFIGELSATLVSRELHLPL